MAQKALPEFLQRHVDAGDLLRVDAEAIVECWDSDMVAKLATVSAIQLRGVAQLAHSELRRLEGLPDPEEDEPWRV
jgi:hypothetical protein